MLTNEALTDFYTRNVFLFDERIKSQDMLRLESFMYRGKAILKGGKLSCEQLELTCPSGTGKILKTVPWLINALFTKANHRSCKLIFLNNP